LATALTFPKDNFEFPIAQQMGEEAASFSHRKLAADACYHCEWDDRWAE
jgi:hypothetical protein